ncbi:hypothetical protein NPA13_01460 [Mycoplasma sp. 2045]|uniref:hypothetical protein n=1 Tax=Mycoplasma sp. 2045 TaxID=2967301 RepID=UPI00211BB32D|nr:hypothetical protein [Mycoplasma sp. 2045]UUM20664.1 hypothetical protein NPA13_01460 [Mycoplasma sp. 2045]
MNSTGVWTIFILWIVIGVLLTLSSLIIFYCFYLPIGRNFSKVENCRWKQLKYWNRNNATINKKYLDGFIALKTLYKRYETSLSILSFFSLIYFLISLSFFFAWIYPPSNFLKKEESDIGFPFPLVWFVVSSIPFGSCFSISRKRYFFIKYSSYLNDFLKQITNNFKDINWTYECELFKKDNNLKIKNKVDINLEKLKIIPSWDVDASDNNFENKKKTKKKYFYINNTWRIYKNAEDMGYFLYNFDDIEEFVGNENKEIYKDIYYYHINEIEQKRNKKIKRKSNSI